MFIYCCSQKQVILLFLQQNSALWGYEKFICIECMDISQFKRFQFVKTNSQKIRGHYLQPKKSKILQSCFYFLTKPILVIGCALSKNTAD